MIVWPRELSFQFKSERFLPGNAGLSGIGFSKVFCCLGHFAVSYRIIPQNPLEYRAEVGRGRLQIYKYFRWRWESSRQRPCDKWPMHGDYLLFCYNTSCSDLIHWELSLFPISIDFLPLFGKDNTTSGLARYRVNSNFTSEQLILRDSFPCRRLKANAYLKIEETNHLFFFCLIHENPPVCLWRGLDRGSLLLAGSFSSRKGSAPSRKLPPSFSSHCVFWSGARSLGISSLFLL